MGKVFCFITALLMSIALYSQTTNEYHNRGVDKYKLQDYRGAITDFTKAIELDTNEDSYYG
jgi:Tfp pilus assembly protein PilF